MARPGHSPGLTRTQRYHAHYSTAGMGNVYQGQFKSFPVQSDEHFLTVERNAYAAQLCEQPEDWKFSSLRHWQQKTNAFSQRVSWCRSVGHPIGFKWSRQIPVSQSKTG